VSEISSEIQTGALTPDQIPDQVGTFKAPGGGESTFKGDFTEGINGLTCVNLEAKKVPEFNNPNVLVEKLVFTFTLDGHESQGVLAKRTSFSLHEKSNLPKIAKALETTVEAGAPIKRSDFVSKKCKCLIEAITKTRDDGTVSRYPRIAAFIKA
jgi:hypothetical protein